ncbi:MAG: hypothetical protein ACI808_001466 [Paraglaciecola sp.]|jgi:hypothetical protein
MNHPEFLEKLEEYGYERQGTSSSFLETDDWIIGFIGLSGRFQQTGTKAFVICARPKNFGFMDDPKKQFHSEPMEYPFKLTLESFNKKLKYQSQLLRFEHSRIETEADWEKVFNILTIDLPESLSKLEVSGLIKQLKKIKEPGYVEKIWLGEQNA